MVGKLFEIFDPCHDASLMINERYELRSQLLPELNKCSIIFDTPAILYYPGTCDNNYYR